MYRIDDQLRELDLTFFDLTYKRLILRMNEVENLYASLLSRPFDFEKKESFDMDYEENYSSFKLHELKSGESNSSYRH